jgi:hypothetical protein
MPTTIHLSERDLLRVPPEIRAIWERLPEVRVGEPQGESPPLEHSRVEAPPLEIGPGELTAAIASALREILPRPRRPWDRIATRLEQLEPSGALWAFLAIGAFAAVCLAIAGGVLMGIALAGELAASSRIVELGAIGAATWGIVRVVRRARAALAEGPRAIGDLVGDIVLSTAAAALAVGMRP